MEKTISVIMPTHDRADFLPYTLSLIGPQIKRNKDRVELVICNNASNDNTIEVLEDLKKSDDFFEVINYNDFVDIGVSIARSVDNATGKYVLLWGDDDVPCPLLIDTLLYYIDNNPDVACFHYNRLAGVDAKDYGISELKVSNTLFEGRDKVYESSEEFIAECYQTMGFLSADLFLLSSWKKGKEKGIDCSKHYGFEFLAPIFCGIKGKKNMYINFPLCIQRAPNFRKWLSRSPLFRYIGMPNLLQDLEKLDLIHGWNKIWNKHSNSSSAYIHLIPQMVLDKKMYKSRIREMNSYQTSLWRKLYAYFCLYCVPQCFYLALRNRRFKK